MLWIMNASFPSSKCFLPIILIQMNLGYICPKNLVPALGGFFSNTIFIEFLNIQLISFGGFFRCFLSKFYMTFLSLSNTSGLTLNKPPVFIQNKSELI